MHSLTMARHSLVIWIVLLFAFVQIQDAQLNQSQDKDIINQEQNNIISSTKTIRSVDSMNENNILSSSKYNHHNTSRRNSRRLQFEGMFESRADTLRKRKKGSKSGKRISRSQALTNAVDEILLGTDRYVLWWRGPPEENKFTVADWSEPHHNEKNAIFTMAVIQGGRDKPKCSTPNDLHLFFGSLRRVFDGDIVVAIEASSVTQEVKSTLQTYKVVVYILPSDLCSRATHSIFCGSEDERVPASVFRYYFYEIWASLYSEKSFIMISDFHDMLFQSNPLSEKWTSNDWFPEYQLVFFQEFHPNMVINRCAFNSKIMSECYGAEALRQYGGRIILSSGAVIGTRDALVYWSHAMTQQLQEAPGRMVETRCLSGGIDHSFMNYLVYSHALRPIMSVKLVPQGEGAVNTIGGLQPNTVVANITGGLVKFWHILSEEGHILNWNGEVSPAVHQADHFLEELEAIADKKNFGGRGPVSDRGWQALSSVSCLWGCDSTTTSSTSAQNSLRSTT